MSSNPSNREHKKVTSIFRKIQWLIVRGKLRGAFANCIGLFVLLVVVWIATVEYMTIGKIDFDLIRTCSFAGAPGWNTLMYEVYSGEKLLLSTSAFYPTLGATCISGGLYVLRVVGTLINLPGNGKKVKKILAPIDEIAVRADEFAKLDITDDKYQLLENAIDSMSPEDTEIKLNDRELQGIQDSMNKMITRMKESYRQQARFVNDASHELRTPIAVIEGYANMLSRWGKEDEKVLDESITAIKNESEHMKHLVEQLLFLARGDAGRTAFNKQDVSINSMMQEIYEESLMIDENHPYRFHPCETDVVLSADPGLLKQAVRILVDNAAKYTKAGDEIVLSTGETEKGEPYLQVQDTGAGMEQADVEHMFERFYRADKARNTEGNGLGLSIAKWIVDKHGGYFSVVSRTELGTRIRIVL